MATIRPDDNAIDTAARHYGITLDQSARLEWPALIDGALGSYDVVDQLYADEATPARPRHVSTRCQQRAKIL